MSGTIKDKLSVGEIAEMLKPDADAIARALLPRGSYVLGGREWRCTSLNSPTGSTISVHVGHGAKQGVCGFWNEAKEGGDLLNLYALVNNCDAREAVQWAKDWLGIEAAPATRLNLAQQRKELEAQRKQREAERENSAKYKRQVAARIWRSCGPLSAEALIYLAKRGVDSSFAGPELRFHPCLPHPTGGVFPTIVARVVDADGRGIGVWRTYLKPTGEGKAPVDNPRLGLGECSGGACRIGGNWTEIAVAEGFETTIASRQLIKKYTGKDMPGWAALSSSGMAGLIVPDGVKVVHIFADNDPVKFRGDIARPSAGLSAAERLAERLRKQGVTVHIHVPPVGMDWLDVLGETNAGKLPSVISQTESLPIAA